MRVLVTGGEGLVGSAVVACLLEHGHDVTTLTLPSTVPLAGVRVARGDARDRDAVFAALDGAEAVAHLAAIPNPWAASPPEVFANNTQATFTVLWTAGEVGLRRFVIAGSINALGLPFNPHRHLPPRYPLDETTPSALADPYSLSKAVDEQTLRAACHRFAATGVCLRLPLVLSSANATQLRAYQAGRLEAGAGEAWSWIDSRDAAEAFRLALTVPFEGTHVVQLAAPVTISPIPTQELLRRFAPGVPAPAYPGHAVPIDTSRARTLLGFTPRHHDTGLAGPSTTEG